MRLELQDLGADGWLLNPIRNLAHRAADSFEPSHIVKELKMMNIHAGLPFIYPCLWRVRLIWQALCHYQSGPPRIPILRLTTSPGLRRTAPRPRSTESRRVLDRVQSRPGFGEWFPRWRRDRLLL